MNVGVIALPGCWDSGLTSVLDVLRAANSAREQVDRDIPAIRAQTVAADRAPVPTAGRLLVPVDLEMDDDATAGLDTLVIPALAAKSPAGIVDALMRDEVRALRAMLREWSLAGRELAAACTGTFVLAESGLLDNRRATTSWWLSATFRNRYPKTELDTSRMVVHDGKIVTAGAAFAHIDLAMSLVSRVSPQLADATAAALLVDERPARSIESALGYLADADRLVTDFETWVRSNLERDVAVTDAALAIGTTRRTLERRVRQRLNTTPYALIQRLRVERADHLRRTTGLSLERIAAMVGYRNASTLRALLKTASRGAGAHEGD
ncbi:GlxA family transcriptional regulator [Streptomyces marispadix]|uniref:Helix-turn-helix domain-containing protein n=1 Tax=Streptomyces marispadix TaxID=2922868 RepID=A0ABS9T3S2_9ACTN|nr:helix-turn-helix domain-containing protein [Streptomyces marispadix]MCH6163167.1 helix-turn-helix domain-containing protein [Streptomyces marispadix]